MTMRKNLSAYVRGYLSPPSFAAKCDEVPDLNDGIPGHEFFVAEGEEMRTNEVKERFHHIQFEINTFIRKAVCLVLVLSLMLLPGPVSFAEPSLDESKPFPSVSELKETDEIGKTTDGRFYQRGVVLVKFKENVREDQKTNILSAIDPTIRRNATRSIPQINVDYLEVPPGKEAQVIQSLVSQQNNVAFAELDQVSPPALIPNDPWYANQYVPEWHLNHDGTCA